MKDYFNIFREIICVLVYIVFAKFALPFIVMFCVYHINSGKGVINSYAILCLGLLTFFLTQFWNISFSRINDEEKHWIATGLSFIISIVLAFFLGISQYNFNIDEVPKLLHLIFFEAFIITVILYSYDTSKEVVKDYNMKRDRRKKEKQNKELSDTLKSVIKQ